MAEQQGTQLRMQYEGVSDEAGNHYVKYTIAHGLVAASWMIPIDEAERFAEGFSTEAKRAARGVREAIRNSKLVVPPQGLYVPGSN